MKYYLSGPMAGYPQHNFPAFEDAFKKLTAMGLSVLSPHRIEQPSIEWVDCLTNDVGIMVRECNGIILLPGWPESRGAKLELSIALSLGWPVLYFDGLSLIDMTARGLMTRKTDAITAELIDSQKAWSTETFGPGDRTLGVIDHIRRELLEVEEHPGDLEEWIDLIILAIDGAWRNGGSGEQIVNVYRAKLEKNKRRTWPDWRTADRSKAIEHVREVITP
jgi:hypothetical protein